ncbi:hypothetical protein MTO96_047973 [Rhipicephalus appendiculatus]
MHNVAGHLTNVHDSLPDFFFTGSRVLPGSSVLSAVRYLSSANYSLCQYQGMSSRDHGQGSSCFPGNPYRKIKAVIVTSFSSSIKLVW